MLENEVARFAESRLKPSLMLAASGFLYDARDAESYTLNATGSCIVRGLLEGKEPAELWRDLVEEFEVPEAQARWDVVRFLGDLKNMKLLVNGDGTA